MTDIFEEYRAVRTQVGLLDRSEVSMIAARGKDRFTWLQGLVSNDVRLLSTGKRDRLLACFLDATGHVLSDVILFNFNGTGDDPALILEIPTVNLAKIMAHLDRLLIMEEVELAPWDAACLSLQGPEAGHHKNTIQSLLSIRADHTGSNGFDVYVPIDEKAALLEELVRSGIPLIGQETREILRVETGIPKYGIDMDETTLAPEANLGPTHISLTKGCYIGQEIVARIDSRGHTNRALTVLVFAEGDTPTSGEKLYTIPTHDSPDTRETGRITSVIAKSPARNNRSIALGYVRHEHNAPGTRLYVGENRIGENKISAEVRGRPFYSFTVWSVSLNL